MQDSVTIFKFVDIIACVCVRGDWGDVRVLSARKTRFPQLVDHLHEADPRTGCNSCMHAYHCMRIGSQVRYFERPRPSRETRDVAQHGMAKSTIAICRHYSEDVECSSIMPINDFTSFDGLEMPEIAQPPHDKRASEVTLTGKVTLTSLSICITQCSN